MSDPSSIAAKSLTAALDQIEDTVLITDASGRICYVNHALEAISGYRREELLGHSPSILQSGAHPPEVFTHLKDTLRAGETFRFTFTNRRATGELYEESIRISPLRSGNGDFEGFISVGRSLAGQRPSASPDVLGAGLWAGPTALSAAPAGDGVIISGLNGSVSGFNQRFLEIWRLLETALEGLSGAQVLGLVGSQLIDAEAFRRKVQAIYLEADVEAADSVELVDGHVYDLRSWPQRLDGVVAGRVWSFRDVTERRQTRLSDDIESDRLTLYAQPVVSTATGAVSSYELLVRIRNEDGTLLAAKHFIPAAEKLGLIQRIDRWVVREAIAILCRNQANGDSLPMALNLSAAALSDTGMLGYFEEALRGAAIDPSLLIVEMTETAVVSDLNTARRFIEALRALGCRFSLDDFGVGYSSFHHLKALPADFLKIDASFIRDVATDPVNREIVTALTHMARALGMETIAEGVHSQETLSAIHAIGVDYAQGYWIGRPQRTTAARTPTAASSSFRVA